jgi:hypothetical protein
MGDRTFLLIMGLFLIVAVFAYDRFVTERGDLGPMAKLMDYAGLSQYAQDEQGVHMSHQETQLKIRNNMVSLQEIYRQIDSQREALILNRQELLQKLTDINDQLTQQAEIYAHTMEEEGHAFRSRFPRLEELGQEIIQTQQLEDPKLREDRLTLIKEELRILLEGMAVDSPEDLPKLDEIIEKIGVYVHAQDGVAGQTCSSGTDCLTEALDGMDAIVQDALLQSEQDLEEFTQLTQMLKKEYVTLADNLQASDSQYDMTNQNVTSELQSLTQALVEITQSDLQKLLTLYQTLVQQQQVLMENLDIHHQRVWQVQQRANQRLEEILQTGRRIPRLKTGSSQQTAGILLGELSVQRDTLMSAFAQNDQQMHGLHTSRWQANQHFAENIITYLPPVAPEYQTAGVHPQTSRSSQLISTKPAFQSSPVAQRVPIMKSDPMTQRTAVQPSGPDTRRLQVMEQKRQQDRLRQTSQEQYERLRRQTKLNEEHLKNNLQMYSTKSP